MKGKKYYSNSNKIKHNLKLLLLKKISNAIVSNVSKASIGKDVNTLGFVGKGINKYDKLTGYDRARKATYLAKKRNPQMTSKQMSNYHYKIRIKDDILNGTIKLGWLKTLLKGKKKNEIRKK